MRPLGIAIVLAGIMIAGIYIGMSGLVTQYAIAPGRSSAGTAICSPDTPSTTSGASIRFVASNLPSGAPFHWASDEGSASVTPTGFSVRFSTPGTKTVSLFYFEGGSWIRASCQVVVR
jgi:hypothetical protein